MIKALLAIGSVLTAGWIYTGYRGWTWIPIGQPPREGQIRVACVGDSITYGALIPNWYRYNYPHQLSGLLGKQYCVHNYGMSDRTAMETGNHPYTKELRFKRSLAFQPDIVLLMFGTNDSKPQNWRGRAEFKRQYEKLLDAYIGLLSHPRMILLEPPQPQHMNEETGDLYTFDIQNSKVIEIGEILREIASEQSLETIDMYAFTKGHSEYFLPDGIHPNAVGAQIISEYISRIILKSEEERI